MSVEYHHVTCPKCGHDRNTSTAKKCEICGQRLGKGGKLPLTLIGAGVLTAAGLFGGYTLLKDGIDLPFLSNAPVPEQTTQPVAGDTSDLKILGDTFSGYSTFRNPDFKAALEKNGVTLSYGDEFDQSLRAKALASGQADLIVTTLDQFIKQQPQGKIVGLIDRTVGADAVVLNTKKYPQLKSLLDLNQLVKDSKSKQLSIAYAADTPSEYLALVLDTKFEAFNLSDFQVIKVEDASEAWKRLQDPDQNVAIAILWEPFVTQAQQQGHTVVLSSQDTPKSIVDVLVASDDLVQSQPAQISSLLETYYRRIDTNLRSSTQLQDQIAADGDLSASDAAAVLQGIDFFTAIQSQDWMQNGTLAQRINAIAAVLVLSGQLDQVPNSPDTLFTADLLAKAADNTQQLISLVREDNPELAAQLEGKGTDAKPQQTKPTSTEIKSAPNIGNLQVRGEVKFGVGSAELAGTGKETLKQLAQEIAEFNPDTVAVRVIGHTSRTGSASVNQTLSQKRAQVVVDYLQAQGLKQQIIAEGKGFSEPLPNTPATDARNQRTEVRLVRVN